MIDEVPKTAYLTWANVGIGLLFLLLDAVLSIVLQLGLSASLLTAAARCIIQLTVMGFVLRSVFETNNPWAVAGISCKSFCSVNPDLPSSSSGFDAYLAEKPRAFRSFDFIGNL